jgi:hypothetical protein
MKEATGELNNTVIVVLSVSVLLAFFYFTLWPMIRNNFDSKSKCEQAICEKCKTGDCETVKCYVKGHIDEKFECVYKG